MTETNPIFNKKDLRRLIIPLMVEQTLALTIGLVSILMVAYVGESAVSGVSLVDSISLLVISLFAALATGGAIVSGQYLGGGDGAESCRAARHLLIAVALLSFLLVACCLLLNGPILRLMFGNVNREVMDQARIYFYVVALSYPFSAIYNVGASLFRVMGNSKISMVNAFIMNLINIAGNVALVYFLKWGVFGSALAILIARIISSASMIKMLRNAKLPIHIRSYSLKGLDFEMIRRILKIGIPNGLESSMFQIGRLVMVGFVATFGTASIAANAVANSLAGIAVIPGMAMGLALITVVSRCVGARDYEQAKNYTRMLMKQTYLYLIIVNIPILLLLKPLLSLYNLEPDTSRIAFQLMLIHGIPAMIIWAVSFTLPNALRAAGDIRFTMLLSIFSMFVFRVGGSFLIDHYFGLSVLSVWLAMVVDWCFRSAFFCGRWARGKWKNYSAI